MSAGNFQIQLLITFKCFNWLALIDKATEIVLS